MQKIESLIASTKTVFTVQDLAVLWSMPRARGLFEVIKYYVRVGKLISVRRGLYSLPASIRQYSGLELALKIVPLSYISLSTALTQQGIAFQYQKSIQSVAMVARKVTVGSQKFEYHKIKEDIFLNPLGLVRQAGWTLAGPERAVCDMLYFFSDATFDNLRPLNMDTLLSLSKIYDNASLDSRIKRLIKTQEKAHV